MTRQKTEGRGQKTEVLARLCRVLDIEPSEAVLNNLSSVLCPLSSDSRDVMRGDTFVAYPGEKMDGRKFIAQAIARGANAVIWEAQDFAREFIWDAAWQVPNLGVANLRDKAGWLADVCMAHRLKNCGWWALPEPMARLRLAIGLPTL